MAKYIHGKPKTERVHGIGEYSEEWVDVRRLTWADMAQLERRSAEFKQTPNALFINLIIAWSICDENGDPVPVSAEVLDQLPAEIATPVITKINELFLVFQPPKSDK